MRWNLTVCFISHSFQVLPCIWQLHDPCIPGQFLIFNDFVRVDITLPFNNIIFIFLFLYWQHDELKPLTKSFTDSLSELGNLRVIFLLLSMLLIVSCKGKYNCLFSQLQLEHLPQDYNGSALTLIESLSRYNMWLE